VSIVTKAVKEVATVPVWAKLTPSTTDIVVEARGALLGGADAIVSSNTFTSLPLIDQETLEFEIHVDGLVSTGGLGGPAILPLSLAKISQLTQAFPDTSFSGIGGISTFEHALNYFLLGCGTVQVCTAAMLDHAVGPNVIRELNAGLAGFLERHAGKGWKSVADFVGLRRDRVVGQSRIRRPGEKEYRGGYEAEGYAEEPAIKTTS
jgi:dihydropyrimidine dehydrogenase (NAD+) subunit PreA